MASAWEGCGYVESLDASALARHQNSQRIRAEAQIASPTGASQATFSIERSSSPFRTSTPVSRKSQYRRSLQEGAVPAIPAIPAKFLEHGRPASISIISPRRSNAHAESRRDASRRTDIVPAPALHVERPKTRSGDISVNRERVGDGMTYTELQADGALSSSTTTGLRRKSLPSVARQQDRRDTAHGIWSAENMARLGRGREEDLFLELAQDTRAEHARSSSRHERTASRLSQIGNRRSLPADAVLNSSAERRPKSSGNVFARPSSRHGGFSSDLQRHMDRQRDSPSRVSEVPEDAMSMSGRSFSGRTHRFSAAAAADKTQAPSRLANRVRSPELPSFGRRRPSYGAPSIQAFKDRQSQLSGKAQGSQDGSPADSSEPKRSMDDSASVDSDSADTVWDELDDLKSRIKKLELTGKLPPTSGAAVSGSSSERPRTATTAPTTIDSSPKHERKPEIEVKKDSEAKPESREGAVGGVGAANIHPLLHAALAKAKPLLNGSLYRSLEATAADALQLSAMTGSAGPQGTTFSAASIINGVTVLDRHVRRKADTMVRNLTDLTLALCEGKHEAPSITPSPITLEPLRRSPSIRYARSSLGAGLHDNAGGAIGRPMSRLEARRTSILGIPPTSGMSGNSPVRDSTEDVSASEHESTPSHAPQQPRRTNRTSSRLLSARPLRYDDVSGDEDPTIRPPSRAMTDVGNFRNKLVGQREYSSPGQQSGPPGLRDSLTARHISSGAFESNRELPRVMSLNADAGRRRWAKESTPPVLEEEGDGGAEYQPSSQPRRRITSLGQFGGRRAAEMPARATSLSQRRQVIVE